MCRDPRLWDEPDTYKPERWLESENPKARELPNVYDIVFGFGGRYLAFVHNNLNIFDLLIQGVSGYAIS
jgi:cytochrome P450